MNRWLAIDLKAIRIVKTNAYGHGLIEIAKVLEKEKVDYLAVATLDEAMVLRKNKIKLPILIIGFIDKDQIEPAIKNNISFSVYDLKEAEEIKKICHKLKKKAKIHLKLDTGMHRLGFLPKDFIRAYRQLLKDNCFTIEYIYSHFADVTNSDYRNFQLKVLNDILSEVEGENLPVPKIHFCRSDALTNTKTHFDMVRPGLAIYGLCLIKESRPALSFKTKIVQVEKIQRGDFVGYSLTFRAPKNMRIAIIAVGYADGYGRNLSNRGEVLIKGVR